MAAPFCRFPTFYLPSADLEAWMDVAVPGDHIDYARGPFLDGANSTARLVATWVQQRLVVSHIRREPNGAAVHMVRRIRPPTALTTPASGVDGQEGQLLALLLDHAQAGKPCPSYAEIAEMLNFRDRQVVAYRFRNLQKLGRITVRDGAGGRIVTITGTGLETADAETGR